MSELSVTEELRPLIERPPAITLSQLAPLALLDRTDTKFVVSHDQLREVMAQSIDQYCVLQVNGVRPGRYVTTYFDTPDFAMYHAHHNGERYRYKLRCRSYLDSEMVYVEVKMKNNKDRMVKFRQPVTEHRLTWTGFDRSWLPPQFSVSSSRMYVRSFGTAFAASRWPTLKIRNALQSTWILSSAAAPNRSSTKDCASSRLSKPKFSLMRSPLAPPVAPSPPATTLGQQVLRCGDALLPGLQEQFISSRCCSI